MEEQTYYIGINARHGEITDFINVLIESEVDFSYSHDRGSIAVRSYRHNTFDGIDDWIMENDVNIGNDPEAVNF